MQPGDLVVIMKQPPNLLPKVQGEVGIIEELLGDYASFLGIKITGEHSGCGSVPLDCLALETRGVWAQAKESYLAREAQREKEYAAQAIRFDTFIDGIADKYGLPRAQILSIQRDLEKWDYQRGVAD